MRLLFAALLFICISTTQSHAQDNDTRLYRLDCGDIHVSNLNVFSDTDAYIGKTKDLTVSCYLIKHGEKWIMWDTGIASAIADMPDGITNGPFTATLKDTIPQQLEKLGLSPDDITHVGISHMHFDHSANTNLFKNATLIIQKTELDFLDEHTEKAAALNMSKDNIAHFLSDTESNNIMLLDGDTDIFGDGVLKAISLPGHTAGHMALMLTLPKAGKVILSGDQWHFRENHKRNGVPSFNIDRADTLASSDKLNKVLRNNRAKLIIQHEPKDNVRLPLLPAYLK